MCPHICAGIDSLLQEYGVMFPDLSISIVICTHNNAAGLRQTLAALKRCKIPSGCDIEVLVVDNASSDDTAAAVRNAGLRKIAVQYLYEPQKGLSHARNAGLERARGDAILFTDDDVIVAEDWIEKMATPLLVRRCDAVTGNVTIAPHLRRPWMTSMHRGWLASSLEAQIPNGPVSLVGASMGFHRSVLDRVPKFDPDLGVGAIGSGEDTLFGLQLAEAGYRIEFVAGAHASHNFDVERLKRRRWLSDAAKRGHTNGYISYHWEHREIAGLMQRRLSCRVRLILRRILQPPPLMHEEGCPTWEMNYIYSLEMLKRYEIESRRPRRYDRRGIQRLDLDPEKTRPGGFPTSPVQRLPISW
jgi:glucosyl-dolichyl phosphate glucuronosyltransferase